MKFFVSHDLKKERSLKMMISSLSIFLIFFILSDMAVKASIFGFTPQEVSKTLLGESDSFMEPYPFESLLELIHMDLFFVMMLFILSGALYIRIKPHLLKIKRVMTLQILLILISIIAPFIALYQTLGSFIWYASFLAWHLIFIYIFLDIIYTLNDSHEE